MITSNNVYEDRSAIRQALAILDQEGVYFGDDSDHDLESRSHLPSMMPEEGVESRRKNKQRSLSHSPLQTKPINFKKQIVPHIPFSKFAEDSSTSSTSFSACSSSSSSFDVDSKRKVGGKAKRRSCSNIRGRRNSHMSQVDILKKAGKSVRFSNYDHTIFIPHILDFTSEEIELCWLDEEDYRSIRSRSLTLIEMMEDEKKYPITADYMIVNKHLVCVRGLGEKTSQCTRELDRVQRKLYKSVFRVQEELRDEGIIDPEAIRQSCKKYTKKSEKRARFVGISDEVNVSSKFG
mmetsp:Transcript_3737/g.9782  ORF Transcript_3737/g.9782 Transcript_3737/m.9782 type:complete len:292 (+) Transcript_3737:141-1016(+)|eukprot:CAMPEP_0197179198 /NCGR_PEP_ID=MMETSP1423-20130617/4234_1 /TAXON_ID=476441 /ORGANISM="Pseudo-nitzschia heimii, Strain UNC1101" /LENGTH=291 /DNA_ID=CAMNT_0042629081 /DNA_START=137 /DNA_END=1012 /DNA_ORIENTATION=+